MMHTYVFTVHIEGRSLREARRRAETLVKEGKSERVLVFAEDSLLWKHEGVDYFSADYLGLCAEAYLYEGRRWWTVWAPDGGAVIARGDTPTREVASFDIVDWCDEWLDSRNEERAP